MNIFSSRKSPPQFSLFILYHLGKRVVKCLIFKKLVGLFLKKLVECGERPGPGTQKVRSDPGTCPRGAAPAAAAVGRGHLRPQTGEIRRGNDTQFHFDRGHNFIFARHALFYTNFIPGTRSFFPPPSTQFHFY